MPFHDVENRRYFTFEILNGHKITHAVFTRRGGVSPKPWESLNVGGGLGDESERVIQNRFLSFETLGRERDSIYDVWQIHSAAVEVTAQPRDFTKPYVQADAILTDNPQVSLFMRFADCVPILLHDPVRKVVGVVHAGWQGTVKGTVKAAIETMQAHHSSRPEDVLAAIGPSIGPDHYEVGPEVSAHIGKAFGRDSDALLTNPNGSRQHLDLWAANRLWLERCGVRQIEVAGICTACHVDDWFSHRAEQGCTGRFGVLIALTE